jgi:hypothetical protein
MLPVTAAYTVAIIATLILAIFLAWLLTKASKFLVVPGFVIGVCIGFYCWSKYTVTIVEIVDSNDTPIHIAFFRKNISTTDGQTVTLTPQSGRDVFIINETDTVYEVTRIYYGDTPMDPVPPALTVHTHSYLPVEHLPDYYPSDHPNEKIWVDTKVEGHSQIRTWLRRQ